MAEKEATELFLLDLIFDLSDYFICVVNGTTIRWRFELHQTMPAVSCLKLLTLAPCCTLTGCCPGSLSSAQTSPLWTSATCEWNRLQWLAVSHRIPSQRPCYQLALMCAWLWFACRDKLTRSLQNSMKTFREVIVVHNLKEVMSRNVLEHLWAVSRVVRMLLWSLLRAVPASLACRNCPCSSGCVDCLRALAWLVGWLTIPVVACCSLRRRK